MRLDDLLPHILADAPGCPDVTAKLAILKSAREFCREAPVWTELQDPMPLSPQVTSYTLEAPAGADVVGIIQAWCNGSPMRPLAVDDLDLVLPGWQDASAPRPFWFNLSLTQGEIRFFPRSTEPCSITLRAQYAPQVTAQALPDSLVSEHLEAIVDGALARLLMVPGRSWSDPNLGAFRRGQFDNAIASERASALHDGHRGVVTVRPVRFG